MKVRLVFIAASEPVELPMIHIGSGINGMPTNYRSFLVIMCKVLINNWFLIKYAWKNIKKPIINCKQIVNTSEFTPYLI